MVVDPAAPFAYVANGGDNTITAYSIDATTGALTPVSGSPFATGVGTGPHSVTVDPRGNSSIPRTNPAGMFQVSPSTAPPEP